MIGNNNKRAMAVIMALTVVIAVGLMWLWWHVTVDDEARLLSGCGLLALLLIICIVTLAWWRSRRRLDARASAAALSVAQRRHDISERRFRALLESLPKVAVQGYDRERRVIYWNEASTQLYGYRPEEVMGRPFEELIIPAAMRDEVVAAHRAWIERGVVIPAGELELVRKSGESVDVFSHHVMLGEHTEEPLLFCVDVDLSDQKQARRELNFITRFDPLTLLPNRATFETELEGFVHECRCRQKQLAVLFIDLDRFAEINEARGYEQGSRVLVQVAERLRRCQRGASLLSRFGDDEFVMAFAHLDSERDVLALIDQVSASFTEPFMLEDGALHVTVRLGVSLFPANGDSARELIHNADVAKNQTRLANPSHYHFFDQQVHNALVRQHTLLEQLRHAIDHDELEVYYQPQVAAVSGRIENLEALIRWFPRGGGAVPPSELIALAERSGLIHRLGEWIVERVCRQQAQWKAEGLSGYRIDINFSGQQVGAPGVFDRLEACMQRHQLTPRDIGIELTENVLIAADNVVLEGLRRLYHRGMKIAIDDFGTGYSSLSYLRLFPVTAIKVDRCFIKDAPTEPSDRAILAGIVFIGHRLGLEVVAEGVETLAQLELVRELNCDLVQGYYYFRAMSAVDVQRLLRDQPLVGER